MLRFVDSDEPIPDAHGGGVAFNPDRSFDCVCIRLRTHIRLDASRSWETVVNIDQKSAYAVTQHLRYSSLMVREHPPGHLLIRHRVVGARKDDLIDAAIAQFRKPV